MEYCVCCRWMCCITLWALHCFFWLVDIWSRVYGIRREGGRGMRAFILVLDGEVVCILLLILYARILCAFFPLGFSVLLALLTIIVGNLCCSFLALLVFFVQIYDDMKIVIIKLRFVFFGMLYILLKYFG